MVDYKFHLIYTVITIVIFVITKLITKRIIGKVGRRLNYQSGRIKITNKIVDFLLGTAFVITLIFVWGVDQSKLLLFLSTTLTILGVAFFAQWSIISNITSTLIIFFNHPIKIGDYLAILDKDYPIEGKLSDVGIFFVTIKTKENEKITLPSNVFMQKMIKKKEKI